MPFLSYVFVAFLAYFLENVSSKRKWGTFAREAPLHASGNHTVCTAILTGFDGLIGTYNQDFLDSLLFYDVIVNDIWKTSLCRDRDSKLMMK